MKFLLIIIGVFATLSIAALLALMFGTTGEIEIRQVVGAEDDNLEEVCIENCLDIPDHSELAKSLGNNQSLLECIQYKVLNLGKGGLVFQIPNEADSQDMREELLKLDRDGLCVHADSGDDL